MLCRVASISARHLQIGSKQPSETINQSLRLIAAAELSERPSEAATEARRQPVHAAEPERAEDALVNEDYLETSSRGIESISGL